MRQACTDAGIDPDGAVVGIPEAAFAYVLFTALMLMLARWWVDRTARPWIPEHLRA